MLMRVFIDRLGGCHQLGNVPPVGADIMECTVARHRCCGTQSNAEEAHVIRGRHLSARHGELGVLRPAATHHVADAHVVRRVQERHVGAAVRHQVSDVCRRTRVAAEQLVRAEHPQVARLADCKVPQPIGSDTVLRVGNGRFKIGRKLIDLDRLEAEDRDIKTLRFQQSGQLRYFDRKALTIPARVVCNLVVSNRKGAPSRRRKSRQYDHRHFRHAEELRCFVAALARDEFPILSHQQRVREAERDHAVCDLADLPVGMRLAIAQIEFDLTDRQFLHPQIHSRKLGARSTTGWHAGSLRSWLAISSPRPARLCSHLHPPERGGWWSPHFEGPA